MKFSAPFCYFLLEVTELAVAEQKFVSASSSASTFLLADTPNYEVVQNLILKNFIIENFVKILLVWPLLGGPDASCYHSNQNIVGNRSDYCEFIYIILL